MLSIKQNKKGNYICTLSYPNSYYSQNNNEIDPSQTCSTTSMIQALDLCGYSSLFSNDTNYKQPEDNLTNFIRTNEKVLNYYKKIDPYNYTNWKNNVGSAIYPPNEIHDVLSYGTNLWVQEISKNTESPIISDVTKFTTNFSINDFSYQILVENKPLVVSGVFHKLNHVITCIGVEVLQKSFESKNMRDIGFFDCNGFIFNDSYGYTLDYTSDRNGEEVMLSLNQIITLLKNKDNPTEKWVHYFI